MAININFNMSWTKTIERERATQAAQRRLQRAKSDALLSPAELQERDEAKFGYRPSGRKRIMVHKKKQLDSGYIIGIASPGYGRAAAVTLPHKEGSNGTRPNEMWPVLDGSVLPKPERAPREYPSNYVFAQGDECGYMYWKGNDTHLRESNKDKLKRQLKEAEEEQQMHMSMSKSAPSLGGRRSPLCCTSLPDVEPTKPPKRMVRPAQGTHMGFMIWPQDVFCVH